MENNFCACGCGEKVKTKKGKYCSGHWSRTISRVRENSPSWKGGEYFLYSGYKVINLPSHPRAMSNGYVREHILIAENVLGKPLPEKAQVHHYGKITDNSKLVICEDQQYHSFLHARTRAISECGDASKRKCKFCQKYDDINNLFHRQLKSDSKGWNTYHYECAREYDRKRYREGKRK